MLLKLHLTGTTGIYEHTTAIYFYAQGLLTSKYVLYAAEMLGRSSKTENETTSVGTNGFQKK